MQLIKWDEIRHEIETCKDWDTLDSLTDKVKAFQIWAKQTKQSLEAQNQIAEYRLRLERNKGNWLNENVPHGGDGNSKVDNPNLRKLGVSKNESSTARHIASIPEEDFELFITEKKDAVNNAVQELTTTGAVRLAKSLQEKRKEVLAHNELQNKWQQGLQEENDIRELAETLRKKYNRPLRRLLAKLITIK